MFQFEDKDLKTSFKISSAAGTLDTEPQFLPSLIMEEKWDNEDFPALTVKASHLGSSQRTRGGCPREKGDSLPSKKWDAKGYYVQDYTVAERTALMESVYPQLYLYCKQRGYDFRMIDLRRGVEDPVTDHHESVELHLEMLKRCQETEGPSFFLFTGQKHEFQSLPTIISQKDFEAILNIVIRDRERVSKRKSDLEETPRETQSSITNNSDNNFTLEPERLENERKTGSTALMSENTNSLEEDEEEAFLARCWADFDRDLTLLLTWYRLDENTVPPVYRLLPVSTNHPDFLSRDGERRKAAKKAWYFTCKRICRVLQSNGPEAIGDAETLFLLRTVMDWEVEQGLGAKLPAEEYSHCYKRTITDLLYNLKSEYASQFIDLLKGRAELNHTLYQAQQTFIHNIHRKLRHTNIYEVNVSWGKKGLSPKHNRSHQFYTDRLCSHFLRTVMAAFNRVMHVRPIKGSFDIMRKEALRTQIQEEIQLHLKHGKTLAQSFELRQNFLLEVRDAVQMSASSQNALLLLGEPGLGKSTILAKVTELLPTWIPGDVTVLGCFVGLTSDSRNMRLLLQSLCTQIAEVYCKSTEISESLAQLCNELHSLLTLVNETRPLALVLDGLDELSEEHEADLSWLYTPLPRHVYTILSANSQSTSAHSLQAHAKVSVLTIPPLSSEEIKATLTSKLLSDTYQLREDQWSLLLRSCLFCPFPMYLRFAYTESRKWTSFSSPEQLSLPGDVRSLFLTLLAHLEREYGENLVRRATSLIALSRGGVTEEELLKLLGHDRRVSQELTQLHNHIPTTSGFPSVPYGILARLKWELRSHIMEVESDGTWVLCFAHTEFSHVILQRYLKTEDLVKAIHIDFADYFSCSASDSHIFQPLAWSRDEDGRKCYVFNLRKLHGLPYHLIHSGQILSLFSKCLFDYEFLLHKVWGLSINHVEEDLKAGVMPDK
ncbi:NACHT domain- and WD repeat-containing protein 1 [Hemibagrus wyckioides]|uniref:NACHT domain- and WD repeat-containing protein 1 n=1 Tax=Hemibagrus wyckioides TaxID=337641 RepID=UPI00266C1AA5|nr:NACHT domain- and WD repeat-containing protein 1 [Hemibagrus wyckioides]